MKTFATMTAVAALIAGMSIAHAQTTPTQGVQPSPSAPNAVPNDDGRAKSGSQMQGTKQMPGAKGQTTMGTDKPGANSASAVGQSPADPNARPMQSGDAKQSGTQSKESQMKSGGKPMTAPTATTGASTGTSANSPSAPGFKPNKSSE